jgi:hypothetical protein
MHQRKINLQPIRQARNPFRSARVFGNHDTTLVVWDLFDNVSGDGGFGEKVVYGLVEEPLDCRGVQVHCYDVVYAGNGQHVCHHCLRIRGSSSSRVSEGEEAVRYGSQKAKERCAK